MHHSSFLCMLGGTRRAAVDDYMSPPAVTLTFDLLTSESNQHIGEPKYIFDQNLVKFTSLVLARDAFVKRIVALLP